MIDLPSTRMSGYSNRMNKLCLPFVLKSTGKIRSLGTIHFDGSLTKTALDFEDEENYLLKINDTEEFEHNTTYMQTPLTFIIIFSGKNGINPSEVCDISKYVINECENLKFSGLMTIGKFGYDISQSPNPDFISLNQCREKLGKELNLDWRNIPLSMGMSDDFEHAVS